MVLPLEALERAIQLLIADTQDLNPSVPAELSRSPTPVEFARFVATNRPVVLRGEGQRMGVPALKRWSNTYLGERLGGKRVSVAVSPDGRADSIVEEHFVEPASMDMTLEELFAKLDPMDASDPVYYLQSQNGNLSEQLSDLAEDVGNGPSWANEVFGELPDVANVWIGDGRSVTSMHKDPYENIYMVVRGSKTFTLLPPTEFYCLHECEYPSAQYSFSPSTSTFTLIPSPPRTPLVPWIPVNPSHPDLVLHPRYAHARPMTVVLHPGDMLYLPALWFHQVAQSSGPSPLSPTTEGEEEREEEKGAAIAVNWWTDMKMDGAFWSMNQFLRRATLQLDGRTEPEI